MKNLKKYTEEKTGVSSLIRLQSLIVFCFTLVLIIVQVVLDKVYVELDGLLLIMSFAPKTIQKFAEARMYQKDKEYE